MFDELYERTESGMIVREVKHCCADCGDVIEVHEHSSWQEIKDCQAGMRALCERARAGQDALPLERTRAGGKGL